MPIKSASVARHQAKHKRSTVWWTPEDFEQFKSNAKQCGLDAAEYTRRCCLDQQITPKADTNAINTLLKLGGLQVKLIQDLRTADGNNQAVISQLNSLYSQIKAAISELRRG